MSDWRAEPQIHLHVGPWTMSGEEIIVLPQELKVVLLGKVTYTVPWDHVPGAWTMPDDPNPLSRKQAFVEPDRGGLVVDASGFELGLGAKVQIGCRTNEVGPAILDEKGRHVASATHWGWKAPSGELLGSLLRLRPAFSQASVSFEPEPRARTSGLAR